MGQGKQADMDPLTPLGEGITPENMLSHLNSRSHRVLGDPIEDGF